MMEMEVALKCTIIVCVVRQGMMLRRPRVGRRAVHSAKARLSYILKQCLNTLIETWPLLL